MRIVRHATETGPRYALVEGEDLLELSGDPFGAFRAGARVASLREARLLAPVQPANIVCVGNNYDALLAAKGLSRPELPNVFLKGANAVTGPDTEVVRPPGIERFEFEGELTLVIGSTARRVRAADWRDHVLGFTIGNDLTAREWQEGDTQWWRAKSADTFCPLGPWIDTELDDPESLGLRTLVNGRVHQDSSTRDLTFKLGEVMEIVTSAVTLQPGDVILTGTPPGFVPLHPGDVVEVEIERLGTLRNTVREAQP